MRCKVGIPRDEMSLEELERYKKAEEIYNYRRKTKGLSMQFTVEYIFHFIKEWDTTRMKIKKLVDGKCGKNVENFTPNR